MTDREWRQKELELARTLESLSAARHDPAVDLARTLAADQGAPHDSEAAAQKRLSGD